MIQNHYGLHIFLVYIEKEFLWCFGGLIMIQNHYFDVQSEHFEFMFSVSLLRFISVIFLFLFFFSSSSFFLFPQDSCSV